MRVMVKDGELLLCRADGSVFASGFSAGVRYTGSLMNTLQSFTGGTWTLCGNTASCGNVTVEFTPHENGILLRTSWCYDGEEIPQADTFCALRCTLADVPRRILLNVPHDINRNRLCDMQSKVETVSVQWGGQYDSAEFAVCETSRGAALFGLASFENYFGLVHVQGDGICEFRQSLEKHPVHFGETLVSDSFYFSEQQDVFGALTDYGNLLAVPLRFPAPVGHCSWYYYKKDVCGADILENEAWLATNQERFPVQYIQIDDGWYDHWGDWNANEKFDMPALTAQIRADGFVPGIWFCPFGAKDGSRVLAEHPEFFVRDADGTLWCREGMYCLDFSRADACDYLRGIVRRFVRDWQCGYIKMDILSRVLAPGVYHDPAFNALKNYRRCLRIVRETAGENVFLLGCTAPLLSSVGLVDGMRVSGDVFDHWESIPRIFGRIFKRHWMNGVLFWNDADCLIVRTADEEDDRCRRPCTRTAEELKTFAAAMAASGGALMLSDKMPLLKKWQLRLLDGCFPMPMQAAVPLDLTDSAVPGILDFGTKDGQRTILLINWGDTPHTFRVSMPQGQSVQKTVAPHECIMLP